MSPTKYAPKSIRKRLIFAICAGLALSAWGAHSARKVMSDADMDFIRSTAVPIQLPTSPPMGTWTGGGGNGVACFSDEEDANNGDPDLIQSLSTTDLWEFQRNVPHSTFIQPLNGESPEAYLTRILDTKIRKLSPQIASRLLDALQWVLGAQWNPRPQLDWIDDLGPRTEILPHCRRVQLVTRYSKALPLDKPDLFFDFDSRLQKVLRERPDGISPVVQEASIQLHEALYLVATDFGRRDSSDVRPVVGALLSEEIDRMIQNVPSPQRATAFRIFLSGFGFDQVALLYGASRQAEENGPFSVETRRDSYTRLRIAIGSSARSWLESHGMTEDQLIRSAKDSPHLYAAWSYEIGRAFAEKEVPRLGAEAVFLYLALMMDHSEDFESMLIERDGAPHIRKFCSKISRKTVEIHAETARRRMPVEPARVAMFRKALRYCDLEQLRQSEATR